MDTVMKHCANGGRETKNNHTLEEPFVVAKSAMAAVAAGQPTATCHRAKVICTGGCT